MNGNPKLVERIKLNFGRKSNAQLEQICKTHDHGRWSLEACLAAESLLKDRALGLAQEPQIPEDEVNDLSEITYDPELFAMGVLGGLLMGHLIVPYLRLEEIEDLDLPIPFGPQMAWISVLSRDTALVAQSLGLHDSEEVTWGSGIEAAHAGRVYVSPPLGDWTLVVSSTLFQPPTRHAETLKPLLERLSLQFEDAQHYCNYPEIGLYGWARASQGQLVRGYCWLGAEGQTLWNEGELTEEEGDLGFSCEPGYAPAIASGDNEQLTELTEQFLFSLAQIWSIDPTTLDGEYKEPALGLLGSIR